jgi:hypothetical protein
MSRRRPGDPVPYTDHERWVMGLVSTPGKGPLFQIGEIADRTEWPWPARKAFSPPPFTQLPLPWGAGRNG